MYTIFATDNNELAGYQRERIMQRSNLVDKLHFLTKPTYNGIDMSGFDAVLEYKLPVSQEYHSEMLSLSDELYKDCLEYVLPFTTALTKEAGEIELQLSFIKVDLDEDGNSYQQVRKFSPTTINIVPIAAWSDVIPDSALTAVDQRILILQALIKELSDMQDSIINNKADDLSYVDNVLQLLSNGNFIGHPVTIENGSIDVSNGMKVVLI